MEKHISKLASTANSKDVDIFIRDMQGFIRLADSYQKNNIKPIKWENIMPPPSSLLKHYNELSTCPDNCIRELLNDLVIINLNGGLGTTMGLNYAKSIIEVKDGLTFLDITIRQIEELNNKYKVDIPLALMNSFNTHNDTIKIINKYEKSNVKIHCFNQYKYPRIIEESGIPMCKTIYDSDENWCPPGHGNVYESFVNSDMFEKFIEQGKKYVFISNIDNLGATVDLNILYKMAESGSDFIMELTDKTQADVKGGTLIEYLGKPKLFEIAQCPKDKLDEFKSIKKFKVFNTNNLWCSLSGIQQLVKDGACEHMDIIVNMKEVNGKKIIQLEQAAGSVIQYFKNSLAIIVDRSRYIPVKTTSDLFVVQSNIYCLENNKLIINPERSFNTLPLVKLGDGFRTMKDYNYRIKQLPDILNLHHLTISGDIIINYGIKLSGTIIIIANKNDHIDIPNNSLLEDKIITGCLRIMDH